MNQTITKITKNFINLVYPLHCVVCKKSLDPLSAASVCELCLKAIRRNPKRTKGYSACLYEGVLKELIHIFKYKSRISLAKTLSGLMTDYIKDNREVLNGIDLITFVPMQNRRLRERGFNQSKALAVELSEEFGIPICGVLEKTARTKPQNELTRNERLHNLKDAFKARPSVDIKGRGILLVDDVMTTGATLNECSKTLLGAGAKSVRCFTLARGV